MRKNILQLSPIEQAGLKARMEARRSLIEKIAKKKRRESTPPPSGWHRRTKKYRMSAETELNPQNPSHLGDFDDRTIAKAHLANLDQGPLEVSVIILTETATKRRWTLIDGHWERSN